MVGDGGEYVEADGFGLNDWLKAIGGVVFFVAGVLTWWELEYGQGGLSTAYNGLHFRLTGLVPYVIFVGIAILTIIVRTESLRLPHFLVDPLLTLVAAAIGFVLVGFRFFVDGFENDDLDTNSINRGIGLYLAMGAALAVLVGCVLEYRDERAVDDDDDDGDGEDVADGADDTPSATERPPRRSPPSPPLP